MSQMLKGSDKNFNVAIIGIINNINESIIVKNKQMKNCTQQRDEEPKGNSRTKKYCIS